MVEYQYAVRYRCERQCVDCNGPELRTPGCNGSGVVCDLFTASDFEGWGDLREVVSSLSVDDLVRLEIELAAEWNGREMVETELVACPHCDAGSHEYYDGPCDHCYGFGKLCPKHIAAEEAYGQHLARLRSAFAETIPDLAECPF